MTEAPVLAASAAKREQTNWAFSGIVQVQRAQRLQRIEHHQATGRHGLELAVPDPSTLPWSRASGGGSGRTAAPLHRHRGWQHVQPVWNRPEGVEPVVHLDGIVLGGDVDRQRRGPPAHRRTVWGHWPRLPSKAATSRVSASSRKDLPTPPAAAISAACACGNTPSTSQRRCWGCPMKRSAARQRVMSSRGGGVVTPVTGWEAQQQARHQSLPPRHRQHPTWRACPAAHLNTADRGTDARQFLDDGSGIARARFIVIGPDGDRLACQRRPVGFVDGRGGTAHGGGGDDAHCIKASGIFHLRPAPRHPLLRWRAGCRVDAVPASAWPRPHIPGRYCFAAGVSCR